VVPIEKSQTAFRLAQDKYERDGIDTRFTGTRAITNLTAIITNGGPALQKSALMLPWGK
jgi:hypothetical protein